MSHNKMCITVALAFVSLILLACSNDEPASDLRGAFVGDVKPLPSADVVAMKFDNVNLVTKHDPIIRAMLPRDASFSDFQVKYGGVTAKIYLGYNDGDTLAEATRVLSQYEAGTFDTTNQVRVAAGDWKGHATVEITANGGGAYYWVFTPKEHMHLFVRWTTADEEAVSKAASMARALLTTAKQVKE